MKETTAQQNPSPGPTVPLGSDPPPVDDVEVQQFLEGEKLLRESFHRMRDSKLVSEFKKWLSPPLACWVCGFDFERFYGPIGHGFIEAHHREQLGFREGSTPTTIRDLDAVCANCHRMMHQKEPPYTIDELKALIAKRQSGV